MFNVKCFHCGKSFAVDETLAAAWLQEHKDEKPKHYSIQCHFCRRVMKVPIRQIQRSLPVQEKPAASSGGAEGSSGSEQ